MIAWSWDCQVKVYPGPGIASHGIPWPWDCHVIEYPGPVIVRSWDTLVLGYSGPGIAKSWNTLVLGLPGHGIPWSWDCLSRLVGGSRRTRQDLWAAIVAATWAGGREEG